MDNVSYDVMPCHTLWDELVIVITRGWDQQKIASVFSICNTKAGFSTKLNFNVTDDLSPPNGNNNNISPDSAHYYGRWFSYRPSHIKFSSKTKTKQWEKINLLRVKKVPKLIRMAPLGSMIGAGGAAAEFVCIIFFRKRTTSSDRNVVTRVKLILICYYYYYYLFDHEFFL